MSLSRLSKQRAIESWRLALGGWLLCQAMTAAVAAQGIYVCVDAQGKRLTSDRPINECLDRDQRVLNKDGSQRTVVAPRMTAREKADRDEVLRQQALAEQTHKDAVRRDRNLMLRYPNEAAHSGARQAALDDIRKAMAASQKRVGELKTERKSLNADAEFYRGRPLPFKLRSSIEGNEASQQAQQDIIGNHQSEMVRITGLYDVELARLRKLWAGAEPGSIKEDAAPALPTGAGISRASASVAR